MQNSSPIKNYGSASWLSQENNIQTSGNDISPQINSVCLLTISEEERERGERAFGEYQVWCRSHHYTGNRAFLFDRW